jgi:hypothetical protein
LPFARISKWKTMSPFWHVPWLGVDADEVERVLEVTGGAIPELLRESSKGVAWAARLERESLALVPEGSGGAGVVEHVRADARHLRSLAELMHAFRVLFCAAHRGGKEVKEEADRFEAILAASAEDSNLVILDGLREYLARIRGPA